ncbi:MAG: GTPase, partial [Cyanobacteria bacterium P01_C01_bin.38]
PEHALPGLDGEIKALRLELKLLAEVGIIGLPNAGKSTLISALSAARPKIADYPFTTLVPNLGVVRKPTGDGTVFADIPGLIEGASQGAGLGHDFLRHIERTRLLLHVIDATSEDVINEYNTIVQELQTYGRELQDKTQIIALNKVDAVDKSVDNNALATQLNHLSFAPVFIISAVTGEGLQPMLQQIWDTLDALNANQEEIEMHEIGNG